VRHKIGTLPQLRQCCGGSLPKHDLSACRFEVSQLLRLLEQNMALWPSYCTSREGEALAKSGMPRQNPTPDSSSRFSKRSLPVFHPETPPYCTMDPDAPHGSRGFADLLEKTQPVINPESRGRDEGEEMSWT